MAVFWGYFGWYVTAAAHEQYYHRWENLTATHTHAQNLHRLTFNAVTDDWTTMCRSCRTRRAALNAIIVLALCCPTHTL